MTTKFEGLCTSPKINIDAWQKIGISVKYDTQYYVIMQMLGKRPVYNVIKDGDSMPAGGYFDVAAIMRLKGINGFSTI